MNSDSKTELFVPESVGLSFLMNHVMFSEQEPSLYFVLSVSTKADVSCLFLTDKKETETFVPSLDSLRSDLCVAKTVLSTSKTGTKTSVLLFTETVDTEKVRVLEPAENKEADFCVINKALWVSETTINKILLSTPEVVDNDRCQPLISFPSRPILISVCFLLLNQPSSALLSALLHQLCQKQFALSELTI